MDTVRVVRVSQLFAPTRKPEETRQDEDGASSGYELLLRGGFVRPLGAGLTVMLPLMARVVERINAIIHEEMARAGAQLVHMPLVQPADLWRQTGRLDALGPLIARFTDRTGRELVLAVTAEEVAVQIAKDGVHSYRDLPFVLYQIGPKFRDEPRPRAGLLRGRLFEMKDAYSYAATQAQLDEQYAALFRAYSVVFGRCGAPQVFPVASDPGMMGGSITHEFMLPADVGEDTLILCDACGHAANQQVAVTRKPPPVEEAFGELSEFSTPGATTIADLGRLGIPADRTAKAVFFRALVDRGDGRGPADILVMALVRGDMAVNHTKVTNAVSASGDVVAADDALIRSVGTIPGYASPLGLKHNTLLVVVDDLLPATPNVVAGANREGYHFKNVNIPRDIAPDIVADISEVRAGMPCPMCGQPVREQRGIEVGNIFQLGSRYSAAVGATFLDADGSRKQVLMGSYGIGPTRLAASIAEASRDDRGLIWPISVAPYDVHVVTLGRGNGDDLRETSRQFSGDLSAAGLDVLWDDRAGVSPGTKFAVADLWGVPIRVTVSPRSLAAGGVEVGVRRNGSTEIVPLQDAAAHVASVARRLRHDIREAVRPLTYPPPTPRN